MGTLGVENFEEEEMMSYSSIKSSEDVMYNDD